MNVPFPNTAYVESMKRVFAMQKHMLDNFQTNLDQWFERRREGTEATIEMLHAINGERESEKRAEAWQRWVSGTMARIMDDVQTQFDMMAKITGQLAEKRAKSWCRQIQISEDAAAAQRKVGRGSPAKKAAPAKAKAGEPATRRPHCRGGQWKLTTLRRPERATNARLRIVLHRKQLCGSQVMTGATAADTVEKIVRLIAQSSCMLRCNRTRTIATFADVIFIAPSPPRRFVTKPSATSKDRCGTMLLRWRLAPLLKHSGNGVYKASGVRDEKDPVVRTLALGPEPAASEGDAGGERTYHLVRRVLRCLLRS